MVSNEHYGIQNSSFPAKNLSNVNIMEELKVYNIEIDNDEANKSLVSVLQYRDGRS